MFFVCYSMSLVTLDDTSYTVERFCMRVTDMTDVSRSLSTHSLRLTATGTLTTLVQDDPWFTFSSVSTHSWETEKT